MIQKKFRIALVVSHPIQHFCPQYVSFAKNEQLVLKVFFASALGVKKYFDKSFNREIAWNNLNLEKFDHLFLNGDKVVPVNKNIDATSLEAELELYAPDVLITYGYFQQLQKRAQRWAKRNNIALAFISDSERRRQRPILNELIKIWYVRRQFRNIDYFLSVGDANESYYRYYGASDDKILRMPFPIDIENFESRYEIRKDAATSVRTKYEIAADAIVFSIVGKIEVFKRQQDLIAAVKLIEQINQPIVLLIIGEGPNKEELENYARSSKSNKIIFTGFIAPEELPSFYAASDVYCHTSEKDAHSLAVSEAIYMGCPIIISDRCGSYGPTDDVQLGKNGFVYKTGDPKALASLMQYMAQNSGLRMKFSDYSRKLALSNQQLAHYDGVMSLLQMVRVKKQLSKSD